MYDPATQHPVFFTQRMVKLPNGVGGVQGGGMQHPVAVGWQFEEKAGGGRGQKL